MKKKEESETGSGSDSEKEEEEVEESLEQAEHMRTKKKIAPLLKDKFG